MRERSSVPKRWFLADMLCWSRELSPWSTLDPIGPLWLSSHDRVAAFRKWVRFSDSVYPNDWLITGSRLLYFSHWIDCFVGRIGSSGGVVMNLGAGLTSYPFREYRSSDKLNWLDVDRDFVLKYRRKRCRELADAGYQISGNIYFAMCDITAEEDRKTLFGNLTDKIRGQPVTVLIEGLSYYLKSDDWENLWTCLRQLPTSELFVVMDYWPGNEQNRRVVDRLQCFMSDHTHDDLVWRFDKVSPRRAGFDLIGEGSAEAIADNYGYREILEGFPLSALDERYAIYRRVK